MTLFLLQLSGGEQFEECYGKNILIPFFCKGTSNNTLSCKTFQKDITFLGLQTLHSNIKEL